jgi:hypothetical protein
VLQHGVITRRNQEQLEIRSIQNAFAEAMHQNPGSCCFVAVAYYKTGKPQLLRRHGFTELCNALERGQDSAADGRSSVPCVIQVCNLYFEKGGVKKKYVDDFRPTSYIHTP